MKIVVGIKYYAKDSDKMPVQKSINALPIAEQADILARLKDIEEYGFNYSRV